MRKISRSKIIYPTSQLLKSIGGSKILKYEINELEHDAYVSSFCIAMSKLACVEEAIIEDYLIGESYFRTQGRIYPDAVLRVKSKDQDYTFPIELENTQKSEARIKEKILNYEEFSIYRDVIFCFTNERVAKKYFDVFKELRKVRGKSFSADFIFTWANPQDYISGELKSFSLLEKELGQNLKHLFSNL